MLNQSVRFLAFIACSAFLFAGRASAVTLNFDANLDGLQEVPPNAGPGFGFADISLDTITGSVSVTNGSYTDMLGTSTVATVNDAAIGSNGPTILSLTLDSPGTSTGTYRGTGTLTSGQITDMTAGNTYINIRSTVFPSGEIRGQILPLPEPTTLSAMAILSLGLARRRRAVS